MADIDEIIQELQTVNKTILKTSNKADGAAKGALAGGVVGAVVGGTLVALGTIALGPGVAVVAVGLAVGALIGWLVSD